MLHKTHHVSVRGVVIEKGRILVVKHAHSNRPPFWCFPGGRVEDDDETLARALQREMIEETGLKVEVGKVVYTQEFVQEKLLEFFFLCKIKSGKAKLGKDPDNPGIPILVDISWASPEELLSMPVFPRTLARVFIGFNTSERRGFMKFNIYAKEITVTESMREHLEKKLSKVNKIFDENRFISMDVRILKERGQYKLELTAHLSGIVVRVEEKGTDFYLAVDKLADIFEKRLKRFKERKSIKHKLSVREISDSISVSEYAEEEGSMITRRKRFSIKPMTLEEALLQMEMLGHTFFVFRNAESGEVNVLYARKNGSVGLIEMSE